MSSPQIETEPVVSIRKQVQQRGHSASTVFEDWIDLLLFALQGRDDPYLEIVDKYREPRDMDHPRGKRTVDLFANAFGQLQTQMAQTDADVLGAVYEAFGMQSDNFGQHFTPHTVCEMTVELTDLVDDGNQHAQQVISDPACGSGRMLLVAAKQTPTAVFVGQDKDPLCAKMTALNLCFCNVDGYAIFGDSLTFEYNRVWQTSHSPHGGSVRELDDDETETVRSMLVSGYESGTDDADSEDKAGSEMNTQTDSDSSQTEQQSLTVFQSEL